MLIYFTRGKWIRAYFFKHNLSYRYWIPNMKILICNSVKLLEGRWIVWLKMYKYVPNTSWISCTNISHFRYLSPSLSCLRHNTALTHDWTDGRDWHFRKQVYSSRFFCVGYLSRDMTHINRDAKRLSSVVCMYMCVCVQVCV